MNKEIDYEQINIALVQRAKSGDHSAVEEIITTNMGLVMRNADTFQHSYALHGYEYDDLVQEGIMGVLTAVEGYDPEKGAFSTYAAYWIYAKMQRFVQKCNEAIRKPVHMTEAVYNIRTAITKKEVENGGSLDGKDIEVLIADYSKEKGITVESIKSGLNSVCVSLSTPSNPYEDSDTLEDSLVDEINVEETVINGIQHDYIKETLDELIDSPYFTDNDRIVIRKRFGYEGEPWTLKEIAEVMNITPEAVRKTEVKVVRRLRELIKRNYEYREIVEEYGRL